MGAKIMPLLIKQGFPSPFGISTHSEGINFSLFVQEPLDQAPLQLIIEDPHSKTILFEINVPYFTGTIRHILIEGLPESFIYYYILKESILLDPYAKKIATSSSWDNKEIYIPKAFYQEDPPFDWEQDLKPNIALENLIIYEMHVRGFTKDASSLTVSPGTYLGVIEKIPYLKKLGINAVELLPVLEFNQNEYHPLNQAYEGVLKQYWGYSTVSFFSPMNRFAKASDYGASVLEFKQMVKSLHAAGIEVILDVVFNHTAEGNSLGPTQSFKSLGKSIYYILDQSGDFTNYSGCGNTFNCNNPIVIQLIMNALRYFVEEMHVDGFRFDLASIFYRGVNGQILPYPPLLEFLVNDPVLASTKLIAEPWDAAGLYQVGDFFPESGRFLEWNGRYRDTVRQFINGKSGMKGEFATRLSGSQDLFHSHNRLAQNSINFITAHDGFSLKDLVSYNRKHNLANGEDDKDGMNDNFSWNCGEEGATENEKILALRERQMRNFHLALIVSQGIPMLHMGDEYGHTKQGNNNTWCQDNELSWFLWDNLEKNHEFFEFYQGLIAFRQNTKALKNRHFLNEESVHWHGKTPFEPNWDTDDHLVAFTLLDKEGDKDLFIAFNASDQEVEITIAPHPKGCLWNWVVNTSILKFYQNPMELNQTSYVMAPFSSLLLA